MPEKTPLRITLAKPLSLQEIHCLLKKVVGAENQGEVLFFLSSLLFPWKVITGLKKSPFFGTWVFHISPPATFFFFQVEFQKWKMCVQVLERTGKVEWGGRRLCSLGSAVKHPGEMFVILMGSRHGNSFERLPRLCAPSLCALSSISPNFFRGLANIISPFFSESSPAYQHKY